MPSISPSAEAGAFSVDVRNDGNSEVGTSCPTLDRKLAKPIPATPRLNQRGLPWPPAGPRATPSAGSSVIPSMIPAAIAVTRLLMRRASHVH